MSPGQIPQAHHRPSESANKIVVLAYVRRHKCFDGFHYTLERRRRILGDEFDAGVFEGAADRSKIVDLGSSPSFLEVANDRSDWTAQKVRFGTNPVTPKA